MGRSARNSQLESRTARIKAAKDLVPRKAPYRVRLGPGQALGYYKPPKPPGSWIAFLNPGKDDAAPHGWKQKVLGTADDLADPDGVKILNFSQAQTKAREWFKACAEEAARSLVGTTMPKAPYTVADALEDHFEDAKRRGMKALGRTMNSANAHIRPDLGAVEVAKLTRERIEEWLAKLAESPRRVRKPGPASKPTPKPRNFKVPRAPKPLSNPAPPAPPSTPEEKRARKDTANRVLTILKAALNHALDRGRVKHGDAWKAVKPYRGTTSARVRFLTPEEQVRLVNACPEDFRRLVIAALHTGARYGELGRLQARDFNPSKGTLWIAPGKTEKGRHLVLTAEGSDYFDSTVAGLEPESLMFTREGVKRRGRKGIDAPEMWAQSDTKRLMDAACAKAGLEPLTFHELRHTYASGLVNAGCPLAFVAELLGHTDTRMVSKHYGHLAPNALADAVRTLAPKLGLGGAQRVVNLKVVGTAK